MKIGPRAVICDGKIVGHLTADEAEALRYQPHFIVEKPATSHTYCGDCLQCRTYWQQCLDELGFVADDDLAAITRDIARGD
jgi:hypothetical protein